MTTNKELAERNPLVIQFLPMHKRAFGTATGFAAALILFLLTAVTIVGHFEDVAGLGLLAQFFAGYSVTWTGAVVGAAWAGFTGFVMGWFLAFARNFFVAGMILYVRARTDLEQSRNLLDHI